MVDVMTTHTLPAPNPEDIRQPPRSRPYRVFVDRAFDPARSSDAERNLYRFLYRAFRDQKHSSPFSARAQIANTIMQMHTVKKS